MQVIAWCKYVANMPPLVQLVKTLWIRVEMMNMATTIGRQWSGILIPFEGFWTQRQCSQQLHAETTILFACPGNVLRLQMQQNL